jgi:hypothetical protein
MLAANKVETCHGGGELVEINLITQEVNSCMFWIQALKRWTDLAAPVSVEMLECGFKFPGHDLIISESREDLDALLQLLLLWQLNNGQTIVRGAAGQC